MSSHGCVKYVLQVKLVVQPSMEARLPPVHLSFIPAVLKQVHWPHWSLPEQPAGLRGTSRILARLALPASELGAQGAGLPQALPAVLSASGLAGPVSLPAWASKSPFMGVCTPPCNSALLRELHSTVQVGACQD